MYLWFLNFGAILLVIIMLCNTVQIRNTMRAVGASTWSSIRVPQWVDGASWCDSLWRIYFTTDRPDCHDWHVYPGPSHRVVWRGTITVSIYFIQ